MKILRKFIGPVLLAAVALLAVRGLLVAHTQLPPYSALPGMNPGQHVWVLRTSYGLRLPGERWWGYHRWGYARPAVGDALLFTLPPASANSYVGTCRALPGDTVWIDPVRQRILPGRTSPDAEALTIPGEDLSLRVTPSNARLLSYIMRRYEHCRVVTDQHGNLYLDGRRMSRVRLARDYYWVETLPDSFVLVPHDALVGKIVPMKSSEAAR